MRGYRDSRPAHEGNKAVSQPQWGNFGDLFRVVWLAARHGQMVLDPAIAQMLGQVADRVWECRAVAGTTAGSSRWMTTSPIGSMPTERAARRDIHVDGATGGSELPISSGLTAFGR